jgi:hypothetical protein
MVSNSTFRLGSYTEDTFRRGFFTNILTDILLPYGYFQYNVSFKKVSKEKYLNPSQG